MSNALIRIRAFFSAALFVCFLFLAWYHQTMIYLLYQANGQWKVLTQSMPLNTYLSSTELNDRARENAMMIEKIKSYSVNELGYEPTKNYTKIVDQKEATSLWVITASEAYELKPYEWNFPIVGKVSYKGFFKKELALDEMQQLNKKGYDTDLRTVSAWSTLGWFNDPILSSMLQRSKGSFCNLLFHELFHCTYYASGTVDFNENMANFVAHKASLRFLQTDTFALREYQILYNDRQIFNRYMLRQINALNTYYRTISTRSDKFQLKQKAIQALADSIEALPLNNKKPYQARKKDILESKNAYLLDFIQYDSLQDSLEKVFNKIYKGNLQKLVQDLKLN